MASHKQCKTDLLVGEWGSDRFTTLMPLIPPKPVAEPLQPTSGVGGLRNITADLDKLVAPEERSLGQVQTPDLSVKAQERGGEYGGVAAAQDIIGGFVKGLALLPDVVVNAGLRSLEYQKGLERGSLDRDYIDRILRSGSYEEAEPFAQGLLSIGRGEDLGTGSAVGNVLERTGEFAALAVPFASALNRMAQASKASTAARTGARGFGTGPSAVGPTRPAFDPVTGRALGEFAPTTRRGKLGEMLLAPYRASPGTFGAAGRAEIGFGAASGAGAGIEQEAFGGSGLVGGLVAPLAAPLVLGGAKGVARASPIRFAANKLKGSTAGVNDDVKVAKQIYEGRGAEVAQESGSAAARNLVAQTLRKLEGRQQTQAGLARAEEIQTEFGEALFGEVE